MQWLFQWESAYLLQQNQLSDSANVNKAFKIEISTEENESRYQLNLLSTDTVNEAAFNKYEQKFNEYVAINHDSFSSKFEEQNTRSLDNVSPHVSDRWVKSIIQVDKFSPDNNKEKYILNKQTKQEDRCCKILSIVNENGEVKIWIGEPEFSPGMGLAIVLRLRKLLSGLNLRLITLTINGNMIWGINEQNVPRKMVNIKSGDQNSTINNQI